MSLSRFIQFAYGSSFDMLSGLQLTPQFLLILPHRAQIGETTDTLNRLEGDLTIVQDGNSEASKELSALEREAKELNLTSEQLHHQLDVLKNSNFLGEKKRIYPEYSTSHTSSLSLIKSQIYFSISLIHMESVSKNSLFLLLLF